MLKHEIPGGLCLFWGWDGGRGETCLGFSSFLVLGPPTSSLLQEDFSADADRQIIDAVCRAKPKLQPASLRNRSNGKEK